MQWIKGPKKEQRSRLFQEPQGKPGLLHERSKENAIVNMDKEVYGEKLMDKLNNGNIRKLRKDSLPESV